MDHGLKLDQIQRENLKQKCRIRWAVEGDENSRFFHSILKCKYSSFNIKGIHANGLWVESPDAIKHAAWEHFSSRFKESAHSRPTFNSSLFCKLSSFDVESLESSISLEEIKEAVWTSSILKPLLSKVIASIIGPNQSAFLAGRQILDGCLIANEIIRMASIDNLKLLLLKVDFVKAFDSVNWTFLQNTMRQMGFGSK
ncbi:RNA-directed DNA polymerase, eukaryota [Tanacetum coccineum]